MSKTAQPKIIQREKHHVSRSNISPSALKVLYRLKEGGFSAYLVGGSVRDLLLGKLPKDFDIATNAHPEQVKSLFRNCLLIGRRFRLAHIRFGREIIEVATFRKEQKEQSEEQTKSAHGMILRDNVYGTLEEDAWRRDFSVNALYYNIADFSVVDYCNGMHDLEHKTIRIIGNAQQRYQEDPVRLLRAIRFAGKLGFTIEAQTAAPLREMSYLLTQVSPARLFEEALKLFLSGHATPILDLLIKHDLLKQLFPATTACLQHPNNQPVEKFIKQAMHNSDERLAQGKTITPIFVLAVLLWYPMLQNLKSHALNEIEIAMKHTIKNQTQLMTIPKRFTTAIQEIWRLQFRLMRRQRRALVLKMLGHPRFRAAYDFLLLRAQSGEPVGELADWWTQLQASEGDAREALLKQFCQPRNRLKHSHQRSDR